MAYEGVDAVPLQVHEEAAFFQAVPDIVLTGSQSGAQVSFVSRVAMVWTASFVNATGAFRERMQFSAEKDYIDNDKIRSSTFWGLSTKPFYHPGKFIDVNEEIVFYIDELSGSTNTIRFMMGGRLARPGDEVRYGKNRGLVRFTNSSSTGAVVAANGQLIVPVRTETGCHFRLSSLTSAETSTNWKMNLQYLDVRNVGLVRWSPNPVHHDGCSGNNQAPAYLRSCPVLRQAGAFNLEYYDVSGAQNTIYQTLVGERLDSDNPADWD